MAKVIDKGKGIYSFYCPGCKTYHVYHTSEKNVFSARWEFNGNLDSPTFSPSLLNRWGKYVDPKFDESDLTEEQKKAMSGVCHLFVIDGHIHYCGDCTHELSGTTVPMADIINNQNDQE